MPGSVPASGRRSARRRVLPAERYECRHQGLRPLFRHPQHGREKHDDDGGEAALLAAGCRKACRTSSGRWSARCRCATPADASSAFGHRRPPANGKPRPPCAHDPQVGGSNLSEVATPYGGGPEISVWERRMVVMPEVPLAMGENPDAEVLAEGIRSGDRRAMGRAITLIESRRPDHQYQALEVAGYVASRYG